jgi:hypothetical protein
MASANAAGAARGSTALPADAGNGVVPGIRSQAVGLPDETQRFNWQPLRRRSDYFFVKYCYLLRRGSRSRIRAERVEVRDDLGVRAGPCVHVGAPRFDDANDDCRHFFSTLRVR